MDIQWSSLQSSGQREVSGGRLPLPPQTLLSERPGQSWCNTLSFVLPPSLLGLVQLMVFLSLFHLLACFPFNFHSLTSFPIPLSLFPICLTFYFPLSFLPPTLPPSPATPTAPANLPPTDLLPERDSRQTAATAVVPPSRITRQPL